MSYQGHSASEVRALLRLDPELARQAHDAMRHVEEEELDVLERNPPVEALHFSLESLTEGLSSLVLRS